MMEVVAEHAAHAIDYLLVRNIVVGIILIVTVLYVCKTQHIGGTASEKKLRKEQKQYKQEQEARNKLIKRLAMCREFANKIGTGVSQRALYDWDYRIARLFPPIETIGRTITATELIGLFRLIQFVSIAISVAGLVLNGSLVFTILLVLGICAQGVFTYICDMLIKQQDNNIDNDFADVYLLLYCKLIKGTNAHISGVLTDYLKICDLTMRPDEHKDIRKFVSTLVTNISVVSDETVALLRMRELYRTATVVNFCNVATQALRGADMADKLLQFKLDLLQHTKLVAERDAKARAEKAQYAIYAVWVILFEVVGVVLVTRVLAL